MEAGRLCTMANQIAEFFETSNPERDEAVKATAHHLRSFWEPRMRREIIAHLVLGSGEGLSPIARDAIRILEAEGGAKPAG